MAAARVTKAQLGTVLLEAAGNTTSLLVAGASIIAATMFGSWAILLLGGAAYASMVGVKASRPGLWQKALTPPRPAAALPDPVRLSDPMLRTMVAALKNGRAEVTRVLQECPDEVKAHVGFATRSVEELEGTAARLIERAEELIRYLRTVRRDSIHDEIRRLGELARRTTDPDAQREYGRARAIREEQLQAVTDVARAHERLIASILRVVATLEALPSRIVRMRVLDAQASETLSSELDEQIERMNVELLTSEQTLRTILAESQEALASAELH